MPCASGSNGSMIFHSASVTSEGYAFRVIVCTPLPYTSSIFKLSARLISLTLLFFRDSLLVFGTLHTNSAVKTIERILNLYNPDEQGPMRIQVAESLVAVIAQSLVRTTDEKRAAVHEIMINTDTIKDYIKRGEVDEIESLIPKCSLDGMCTMNQSLYKLFEDGRITENTALDASPNSNEMSKMLKGVIN
jgi:Tfp pilus assembly pilus retraction ATPase PilT